MNVGLLSGGLGFALALAFGISPFAAGQSRSPKPPVAASKPAKSAPAPSKSASPAGKPMTQKTLYPIKYGNPGRGSLIEGATPAHGRVAWSHALATPSTPEWPADVLIWDSHPLISTYDTLVLLDREGKRLWERKKEGGVAAAVAADGSLYYKNEDRFIDAVDLTGKELLKSAPFPGATGKNVRVDSFWPRAKDFVAVLYRSPGDDRRLKAGDSEDKPMHGGRVTVLRNDYPTPYGDWTKVYEAEPALAPLWSPGRAVVTLALGKEVVLVAVEGQTELGRFKSPVSEMVEWSVDAKEVYAMTGYEHGHKVLVAFSGDGHALWRWEDPKEPDPWAKLQPPIRLAGDRVCVLTEGRVLAIDAGKLAWTYDVRSEMLRHGSQVDDGSFEIKDGRLLAKAALRQGSGLADGSVLVTSGRSLFHLSAEGKKLFSVSVDSDILSVPVIDAEGSLYVTTATHLVKIH